MVNRRLVIIYIIIALLILLTLLALYIKFYKEVDYGPREDCEYKCAQDLNNAEFACGKASKCSSGCFGKFCNLVSCNECRVKALTEYSACLEKCSNKTIGNE